MASSVHISLNVSDLANSTDFYRRFFGEPAKLKADYAKFVLADPEIHLALQPGRTDGSGALSHLGIRVGTPAAVAQWKERLKASGLSVGDEKREACCYALQEKFWIADPDGNRWEVYTVLEDLESKGEAARVCCAPTATGAPCC